MKNSETEISRWRAPISTAETAGRGGVAGCGGGAGGLVFGEVVVRLFHMPPYKQVLLADSSFLTGAHRARGAPVTDDTVWLGLALLQGLVFQWWREVSGKKAGVLALEERGELG